MKTFKIHAKHFVILIPLIILLIYLSVYAGKRINSESQLVYQSIVIATPTLIPPTYFMKENNPNDYLFISDSKKLLDDLTVLYLNYLQEKEVENLYLLLNEKTRTKYSRADISRLLLQEDLDFSNLKIADIIFYIYSSRDKQIQKIDDDQNKMAIPDIEAGYLFAYIPLNLTLSFSNVNKKITDIILTAEYRDGRWLFDFPQDLTLATLE